MAVEIQVEGLKQLRRDLRKVDKELAKGLRTAHKEIAELFASAAKGAAPGRTDRAISGRASQREALVRVSTRPPWAIGRFMGAKRRFGWYAAARYRNSTGRQFEPWVGNQWDPGSNNAVPYHIGDAMNDAVEEAVELLGDELEKLAAKAFPDGG